MSLNCQYEIGSWAHIDGPNYRCVATVILDVPATSAITQVLGGHLTGKGNADVQGLIINTQKLPFFPISIERFFPNIIALSVRNNSITHVVNAHLIPFPNLVVVDFSYNQIIHLDSNLFSGLRKISLSSFANNKIISVGKEFIFPYTAVSVDFNNNQCISRASVTFDQVTALRSELQVKCPQLPTNWNRKKSH